jgi:hypothetical protein
MALLRWLSHAAVTALLLGVVTRPVETAGASVLRQTQASASISLATVLPGQPAPMKGVNIALLWNTVDLNAPQFDQAAAVGATVFRGSIPWRKVEPRRRSYDPSQLAWLDGVIRLAEARGMVPIFNVVGTPCWAITDGKPCTYWTAPSNVQDYADIVHFLHLRYGARVMAWEVWNEPDYQVFWAGEPPNPAKYAAMVRATKRASPDAYILGGALAHTSTTYLKGLYDNGILGWFDALSLHPYAPYDVPPGGSPDDCSFPPMSYACGVPAIRDTMLARGDSRGIWFTEFGWNSSLVGDAFQARYLKRAFEIAQSWSYVTLLTWYILNDSNDCCLGLYRADGSERPAAGVFRAQP